MTPKLRKVIRWTCAFLAWPVVVSALAIDDSLIRVGVVWAGIACMSVPFWLRPIPPKEEQR